MDQGHVIRSIRLPTPLFTYVAHIAEQEDRSFNQVIKRIITQAMQADTRNACCVPPQEERHHG